jgi:hypothetical protein
LSEPTFENKGTKYLITWPDIHLHAEVSRISMNHESTKCMCIFTTSHEGANPHILQTRINLESTRSRNDLAKDLATRYQIGQSIDWKAITEYLTVKVLREYEKGEPVIVLSSEDEMKPLEYLIHPIAIKKKPTVIFGEPGTGKSQLAVVFGMVLCLPWHDNPLHLIPPKEPTVLLMLDYESDPEDVQRQLASLTKGMNLGYVSFQYRRCTLPLAEDIESIRKHIEDVKAQCLLVDSISLAAGDDPSKPSVATNYFRSIRQCEITSISLAHTSKDIETRKKTIFGSVLWEAGARSVWEIQSQEEENTLNIALFHRKANMSKRFSPQGYQIEYQDDLPYQISWHNPKDVVEFVERMSTGDRILDLLREGKQEFTVICQTLDITPNTARVTLYRLKKKGLVVKLGEDTWGLATK